MAIDTAAKRVSATNFFFGETVILPDGTIDPGDRQSAALIYSGILAGVLTHGYLIASIKLNPALSSSLTLNPAIDASIDIDPALNGTPKTY